MFDFRPWTRSGFPEWRLKSKHEEREMNSMTQGFEKRGNEIEVLFSSKEKVLQKLKVSNLFLFFL